LHRSGSLKTLNSLVFYISCLLLLASCWQRDNFPDDLSIDAGLVNAPEQRAVTEPAFDIDRDGVQYRIEPRYSYDLKGLVVSYEHHDGNYSLHRLWNDHINVADICVVWGENATALDLNKLDFWNGEFTCNFKTSDQDAWERFKPEQLSNNHLLTGNDYTRKMIDDVRIGDQVHIRGWLANYSNDQGFSRGTSITRDDRGNGACETIYVKDFRIVRSMENGWRTLLNISLFGFISSAMIWVVAVVRGVF
jgi:hypothetical protein